MGQTPSSPQPTNNVRSLLSALDDESHDMIHHSNKHEQDIPPHLFHDGNMIIPCHDKDMTSSMSTSTSTSTSASSSQQSSPNLSRRGSQSHGTESKREQLLRLVSQHTNLTSSIINIIDSYLRAQYLIISFDSPCRLHIYTPAMTLVASYQPQLVSDHIPITTHTNMSYVQGVNHIHHERAIQNHKCVVYLDDEMMAVGIKQIIHIIHFKQPKVKKQLSLLESASRTLSNVLAHANDPHITAPVVSATCIRLLMGHSRPISCMTLLSDRHTLISATIDHLSPPRIWSWADGICHGVLDDKDMSTILDMIELDPSYDSRVRILTFHIDMFRIWDVSSRRCVSRYHHTSITCPIPSLLHLSCHNNGISPHQVYNMILFSTSMNKMELWCEMDMDIMTPTTSRSQTPEMDMRTLMRMDDEYDMIDKDKDMSMNLNVASTSPHENPTADTSVHNEHESVSESPTQAQTNTTTHDDAHTLMDSMNEAFIDYSQTKDKQTSNTSQAQEPQPQQHIIQDKDKITRTSQQQQQQQHTMPQYEMDSKHNTPSTTTRQLMSRSVFKHKSTFHVVHSSMIDLGHGRVACSFENTVGIFDFSSHTCLYVIPEAFLPQSQYRNYIETHKHVMHTWMCNMGDHTFITLCDTGRTNMYHITNTGCELLHSINSFHIGLQYQHTEHHVGIMNIIPTTH